MAIKEVYHIFNKTDGVFLTDEDFISIEDAEEYIRKWRNNLYKIQGYYFNAKMQQIPVEEVEFDFIKLAE